MSTIRAIILDFDGVLAESNEAKTRAFEDLFALYRLYRDAMMDYHLVNYSCPRMMKFEHYVYELMRQPGNVEMVQTMACRFSEFAVRRVVACPDVPGTREFLTEFSRQLSLYISSVTPQDELQKIVRARGIDSLFVQVFGDPPWKKLDAIHAVLTREKLLPSEVIFVGDSASDYRAANEAGLEFVGRDSGLPFDDAEIKLYHDFYEITDVVRRRLKG
jgi:phosphoglycolate phosphatase-like HAD superfamily hydrolase